MRTALFLVLAACLAGCGPKEVASPSSSPSSDDKTPALEASSEKVQLKEGEATRLTSYVDKFALTLPPDFRGVVLTEKEIERFASTFDKISPQLGADLRRQANTLRPGGGALMALNVKPSAVVDNFAENMNVNIRGTKSAEALEALKPQILKDLRDANKNAKVSETDLSFGSAKMLEYRIDSQEKGGTTTIPVVRFVYVAVRGNQMFTITYATHAKRAPQSFMLFRASAQSLTFN